MNRLKSLKFTSKSDAGLKSETTKSSTFSRLDELLSWLFIFWIVVIASFFYNSYIGVSISDYLIFKVEDGWCSIPYDGVGQHCFGDFGLPFYWESPYATPEIAAANSPIFYAYFSIFQIFDYQISLILYQLSLIIGILAMMLHATRKLDYLHKIAITTFGGMLSVGLLSSIDRGNHVALMAPLLYFLIVSKNSKVRVALLTLLITMKFWGILFVLIPLALKRYIEVFLSAIFSVAISALSMFLLTENFLISIKNMASAVLSRETANALTPFTISEIGFLRRMACFFGPKDWCTFAPYKPEILIFSIAIMLVLLIIAWIALRKSTWSFQARFMPLVIAVILGLPESGQYVLVLMSVISALVALNEKSNTDSTESKYLSRLILVTVALLSAPISFAFFDTTNNFLHRWHYFVTPISLNILTFAYLIEIFVRKIEGQHRKIEVGAKY